jgi:GAF domain-containing protein/membrane protein implicated in regulation of membrane protease activity
MNSNFNPFGGFGYALDGRRKQVPEVDPNDPNDPNLPENAPKPVERITYDYSAWRERFVVSILRIACVLGMALILFLFPTWTNSERILFISLYVILVAVTLLPVPYVTRGYVLLAINYAIGLNALLGWGPFIDASLFLLVMVVLAALLFDTQVDIFVLALGMTTILVVAGLGLAGLFTPFSPRAPLSGPGDWAIYGVGFSILGIALVVAIQQFKQEIERAIEQMQETVQELVSESSKLEERVQERTGELETKTLQLRSTTGIARNVAEIQNVPELLETVVNSASEQFGYYHVGLYLFDERRKSAFLQASSSIAGRQLIGQGFRVENDRRNAINLVAEQKRPHISSDTGAGIFNRDPNFPLTRSRMVLPLSVRGEVIGVLDMHSDQPQGFGPDDAEVIQTLADLAAISLDNVRLIDETKTLVSQLEAYTAAQTSETWSKFTSRHTSAYQYTPAGVRPIFSPSREDQADGSMQIPLLLHGQSIGNIKLRRKGMASGWSEKERELTEKIAEQVALALENSRLVDEAQRSAQRDQMIANISSRVRETLDVESVIRTATTELRKVFDLKEAEISIGAPQAEPARVRKNTSSLRLR